MRSGCQRRLGGASLQVEDSDLKAAARQIDRKMPTQRP
jgi:hypothetical protein